MRTRDDVFIRTNDLIAGFNQLKNNPNNTRIVWSSIRVMEPLAAHEHLDLELLERNMLQLPPHPNPDLYVLSYDIIALLVQHYRQDFLVYYSVEEVSLGVWLFGSYVHWQHDERMTASGCGSLGPLAVIPRDWDTAVQNTEICGHPCIGQC